MGLLRDNLVLGYDLNYATPSALEHNILDFQPSPEIAHDSSLAPLHTNDEQIGIFECQNTMYLVFILRS